MTCKMQASAALLLLLVLCTVSLTHAQGVDLTLVPEANGTAVVEACIAKISEAAIFPIDNQLLRRIALVETNDGLDTDTYATNNSGGIWQLSQSKYLATKSSSSLQQQIQGISTSFCIEWANTQWQDLRKPLYSALAARLNFYLISASIPLANDITGQANYWASYYTSSGGTAADFINAVNQTGTATDCSVSELDMFFVMDESGSVGSSNFGLMKDFVRAIANSYNIGPDAVRIGVQTYASGYTFEFYLNTYSTKVDVLNAIDNIVFNGGGTNTGGALNAIFNYAFTEANGARPSSQGIPRITIVITDGKSNSYSATVTAAQQLHGAGIIVFAIGIAGADTSELNAIASDPAYVSFLSNFDANLLSNLQVTISNEACVASPEIEIDEEVTSTISTGETKYVNYELPASDQGLTIKLNVSNGSTAVLYASTVIQTPSEAVHDVKVVSDGWGDAYINSSQFCSNGGDKVYIAVEGQTNDTEVTIGVDIGDTSTVPVQVTPLPATISRPHGSNLTLTCNATGKPVPTLSWLKDGSTLHSTQGTTITITTLNNTVYSVLSINSLMDEHAGVYACLGSNVLPNGTLTHTSSFTLIFTVFARNITGTVLTATSIFLSWDEPLSSNVTIDHYLVSVDELETNQSWVFHVVNLETTILSLHPYYRYSCRVAVFADIMFAYSQAITLVTLQAAPSGPPLNPATQIIDSRAINLTWYPPALEHQNGIIQYYLINYTEVVTGSKTQFTSISPWLFVDQLHPYYPYTFAFAAVTIAKGPFSPTYNITTPEDAPTAPPQNLVGSYVDSTSIFLDWDDPPAEHQNGIIREYHINFIELETGNTFFKVVTTNSATISSLHPNYNYYINVTAVTVLLGPTSQVIVVMTPEDVPSGSPQAFNASATSPFSAVLTWQPPPFDQQNGMILGYVINVTIVETGDILLLFSNSTTLTVTNLKPFRTYICIIAAQTTVGTGPYGAQFILYTPEDVPSIPQSLQYTLTRSTVVQLTWLPPSSPNGKLTSYQVIYTAHVQSSTIGEQDRTLDPVAVLVELSDEPQLVISDLIPGLVYEFKVRAKNAAGYGTNASVIVFIPETRTTEPSTVVECSQVDTSSIIGVVFSVLVFLSIAVVVVVVLVLVCKRRRLKVKIHTLGIQDKKHPTIGNPLYADSAMEVTFMGLHSQSPTTTEGNECVLVGTSAVQGRPDDVEVINKKPMIDSEEENDDVKEKAKGLEISDT